MFLKLHAQIFEVDSSVVNNGRMSTYIEMIASKTNYVIESLGAS